MNMVIDIGNTNTRVALFDRSNISHFFKLETSFKSFKKFYSEFSSSDKINNVGVSSVLTEKENNKFYKFLLKKTRTLPLFVNSDTKTNITIKYKTKETLGPDRIVNVVAAHNEFPGEDLIIADFGTALTFDVLLKDGTFSGGLIAPGFNSSIKSLNIQTSNLPEIKFKKPGKLIGRSTIECLESGFYYGWLSLCEGIIERIRKEYKLNFKTIITGGCAEILGKNILNSVIDINLTLKGINHIININKN